MCYFKTCGITLGVLLFFLSDLPDEQIEKI